MSMCRRFHGKPVMRLIVSVPEQDVQQVDQLIDRRLGSRHPANGCRSEFVRLAIVEKLERDSGLSVAKQPPSALDD